MPMSCLDYTQISQPHPKSGNATLWYFERLCNLSNQETIFNTLVDFSAFKDPYLFCLYFKALISTVQLW